MHTADTVVSVTLTNVLGMLMYSFSDIVILKISLYVCTYLRTYVCMYMCVCMYVCMYVCVCIYVCMYLCVRTYALMQVWVYDCEGLYTHTHTSFLLIKPAEAGSDFIFSINEYVDFTLI
jgi:hypothetical protein